MQSLCRAKKISMTRNVLPLHFAPSQASSSQNSNVDNFLPDCHNPFKIPYKILRTLSKFMFFVDENNQITKIVQCGQERCILREALQDQRVRVR